MVIWDFARRNIYSRDNESRVLESVGCLENVWWFENSNITEDSARYLVRSGRGVVDISSVGLAELQNLEFQKQCLILRHINIRNKGRGFGTRTMKTLQKSFSETDAILLGWSCPMKLINKEPGYELLDNLDNQKKLTGWYQKLGWKVLQLDKVYSTIGLVDLLERWEKYDQVVPTCIGFCGSKVPDDIQEVFHSYEISAEEHFEMSIS